MPKCVYCKAEAEKLQRCGGCKMVYYCSTEHQKLHWGEHKPICNEIQKAIKLQQQQQAQSQPTTTTRPQEQTTPVTPTTPPQPSEIGVPKEDDENAERAEDFYILEKKYEEQLDTCTKEYGAEDSRTIETAFNLFDQQIALYHLEKLDKLLEIYIPIFEKQGKTTTNYAKGVQMRAFLRYKQFRYAESIQDFKVFEGIMGPSAPLFENMAHAFNANGQLEEAEDYFLKSLKLSEETAKLAKINPTLTVKENRGGILMGLGALNHKQGKLEQAKKYLEESLDYYKNAFNGKDHSLCAKAESALASCLESMNRIEEAIPRYANAVRVFIVTCGSDSPLTANAKQQLAQAYFTVKQLDKAQPLFREALALHCGFDTLNGTAIFKLLTSIIRLHQELDQLLDPSKFLQYLPAMVELVKQVKIQNLIENEDIVTVLKTGAEICLLARDGVLCKQMASMSKEGILKLAQRPTNSPQTSKALASLLNSCLEIINYLDKSASNSSNKS